MTITPRATLHRPVAVQIESQPVTPNTHGIAGRLSRKKAIRDKKTRQRSPSHSASSLSRQSMRLP